MYKTEYGFGTEIKASFTDAVQRTIEALQGQGFGVLSDIDVKETLKKKLDVDFRRYRILGACNPALAHQALTEENDLGLLLPCNVVVYELDEHDTRVVAVDPVKNLSIVGNDALAPIAQDVKRRLITVIESLSSVPARSE
jgi:uncharacterized protein (DUF302 family)